MQKLLARIHPSREPAAWVGLAVSLEELFRVGWQPEVAIPAAVGLVIRFFVRPA